jgi:hypothetical protein
MKYSGRLKILLPLITLVITCMACEQEKDHTLYRDPDMYDPNSDVPNYSGGLRLYNYKLTGNELKSCATDSTILINDSIQFIRFVSYDSEDKITVDNVPISKGQRNIHEIMAYSNYENIALNKYLSNVLACEPVPQSVWQEYFLCDSCNDFPYLYCNSLESMPSILYNNYNRREGYLEKVNDGLLYSRWSSNRDDGNDTVFFIMNLRKPYMVDSIRLYLGEYGQIFDLWVSPDSLNWKMIGNDHDIAIPVPLDM